MTSKAKFWALVPDYWIVDGQNLPDHAITETIIFTF